eukprot:5455946-Pleurochrysis_carterae.AAC.2
MECCLEPRLRSVNRLHPRVMPQRLKLDDGARNAIVCLHNLLRLFCRHQNAVRLHDHEEQERPMSADTYSADMCMARFQQIQQPERQPSGVGGRVTWNWSIGISMRRISCRAHITLPATGGASRSTGGFDL